MLSLRGLSNTSASGFNESSWSALQWMACLQGEWIMVFDNADSAPGVVENFIPPGLRGNILISSQNQTLGCLTQFENSLEIDKMKEEDAISLLLKASGYVDQADTYLWEMARKIVAELCCLPLAVVQAGASIEAGLCNIIDYLDLYSAKCKELLSYPFFKGASAYQQTVYGTWELSFKEIESRASRYSDSENVQSAQIAILILQIFAFMHYEDIDERIFKHAAKELNLLNVKDERNKLLSILASTVNSRHDKNSRWDKFYFQMGIHILQSFSLIKRSPYEDIYSEHSLGHSWSRNRLSHSEQYINFCRATTILSCSISSAYGIQDSKFHQRLIPHIKAGYQYAAEIHLNNEYDDNTYSKFGLVFRENGDWTEAEKLAVQVVVKRKEILGQDHPNTLTSMASLAEIYWNQGKWNEAEELEIEILDISQKVLGQKHPDTLISMASLALIYSNQRKWAEAEQLQIQVLDMSRRLFGLEHPETLNSMANLALIYGNQERWNETELLQIQALDMSRRLLGLEHPETLRSMANLASIYSKQRRWNEAEQLQIQTLDIRKKLFGQEHPETLNTMTNLASTYSNQKRWNEAEQLQIQTLDIRKKVLGQEH